MWLIRSGQSFRSYGAIHSAAGCGRTQDPGRKIGAAPVRGRVMGVRLATPPSPSQDTNIHIIRAWTSTVTRTGSETIPCPRRATPDGGQLRAQAALPLHDPTNKCLSNASSGIPRPSRYRHRTKSLQRVTSVSLTCYVTEARGGRPLTLPDKPDSYGLEYRFIREAPNP